MERIIARVTMKTPAKPFPITGRMFINALTSNFMLKPSLYKPGYKVYDNSTGNYRSNLTGNIYTD